MAKPKIKTYEQWRAAFADWRKRAELPRRAVVEDLNMSVQNLAHIESGVSKPSVEAFILMTRKMGGAEF